MEEKSKPTSVGAKLSRAEKLLLEAASKIRGLTLSRFLVESALKEAKSIVTEVPTTSVRKGPESHEDRGSELAIELKPRLVGKLGAEEAKIWLDFIGEAALKNDHIVVWNYLLRCLPELVRNIPDRGQVAFAKGFIKAFLSATK